MVKLGIANSRMKYFYDLHSLSKTFEFDGKALVDAVRATFERRGTAFPEGQRPLAFTPEFYEDENKIKQWRAFCNKNKPHVQDIELNALVARLLSFLTPVIRSAQGGPELNRWTPMISANQKPHLPSEFYDAILQLHPEATTTNVFTKLGSLLFAQR